VTPASRRRWTFNIEASAADSDALAAGRTWVREFWQALRPAARSDGGYLNIAPAGGSIPAPWPAEEVRAEERAT
jgi:hypothetical protein